MKTAPCGLSLSTFPTCSYTEDRMDFTQTNAWSLPDEFEIADALEAVRQAGGQVVRTYTLSVRSQTTTLTSSAISPRRANSMKKPSKPSTACWLSPTRKAFASLSHLLTTGNGGAAFRPWPPSEINRRVISGPMISSLRITKTSSDMWSTAPIRSPAFSTKR